MVLKNYKTLSVRILVIVFCLFLAVNSFFQPKRVNANPLIPIALIGAITTGVIAGGYVQRNVIMTPDQLQQTNDKMTGYLKQAFPDPTEYNKQLGVLQNLDNDLKQGKDVDWGKYPGKVIYPVLKGIIDVVWPTPPTEEIYPGYTLLGTYDHYALFLQLQDAYKPSWASYAYKKLPSFPTSGWVTFNDNSGAYIPAFYNNGRPANDQYAGYTVSIYDLTTKNGVYYVTTNDYGGGLYFCFNDRPGYYDKSPFILSKFLGFQNPTANAAYGNIRENTKSKITLPTRLPQTIINNINNYNGTENLIIAPTDEEMKDIPTEDVTPDQPGTTDPEPTPTPTPEPTPEPTPTPPDYNGDKWVNPIGDFMDGLLKFMKAAFVPTLTLNLDALNTMPNNLSEKFPFSLPGDLVRMFSIFQAEPKPFSFDWELDFTAVGAGTIPIKGDISMFDEYAPLFRNLAFIGFLIGLAWRTFGMFFGGGDE